jgi:hypothetical protein
MVRSEAERQLLTVGSAPTEPLCGNLAAKPLAAPGSALIAATSLPQIDRNRIHRPWRQLTKLDLASYKECVAVKEFTLNCRPAK